MKETTILFQGDTVVTASEMARIEKIALQQGATKQQFIEEVGKKGAEAVVRYLSLQQRDLQITILVGKGNNGADALAIGRFLLEKGAKVHAYLLFPLQQCTEELLTQRHAFLQEGGETFHPTTTAELSFFTSGCIIDGIFGTGFSDHVQGFIAEVISFVNEQKIPIISIDIPSGIHGSIGKVAHIAIMASHTLYLGLPKIGCFYADAYNHIGTLEKIEFGIKPWIHQAIPMAHLASIEAAKLFPRPKRTQHKYEAGYLLLSGGSPGMSGSIVMSALAALRSGAGLVKLVCSKEAYFEVIARSFLELMAIPYEEGSVQKELNKATAVLIGPGMEKESKIHRSFLETTLPIVIDAGAIYALRGMLSHFSHRAVLTPHFGELRELLSFPQLEKGAKMLEACQEFVELHMVTLIVKGAPTYIFHPSEEPLIIPFGDPGMATAGSGDVLSGIVGALLSKGMKPYYAAVVGTVIHAKAGEKAAQLHTSHGMIASDIIDALADAIHRYTN